MPKHSGLPALFARPIAHRGLHDCAAGILENSHAAFAAAIQHGFGIECDLQVSADGEAMVFHDATLDRLTGATGPVKALNAHALAALPLKGAQDGKGMQTLGALLAQVAGAVPLIIEVKSAYDGDQAICARIADLVADYAGPLALKSFDPEKVIALRACGVTQPLGMIGMANYEDADYARLTGEAKFALANLLHYAETKPDFLSWHHKDLRHAVPFLCRTGIGLPLMSWTIRDQEAAARAAPFIDQIVFEGFLPAI